MRDFRRCVIGLLPLLLWAPGAHAQYRTNCTRYVSREDYFALVFYAPVAFRSEYTAAEFTALLDLILNGEEIQDEECAKKGHNQVFTPGPTYRDVFGDVIPILTGSPRKQERAATSTALPPYGVASGATAFADLNGDGNADLAQVQTSTQGGAVIVQLLDSGGNVVSSNSYAVGATANDIVVADFNGDGLPDLAVGDDGGGSAPGSVWILLNNGSGTFQSAVKIPVTAGPYHLFAADFNGDGKIDIATANDQAPTVSVLFGNGNGTFQAPVSLSGLQYPGSLVAADFFGTGRADIAVLDIFADTVVVFPANTNGTFQAPQSFPAGYGPGYLICADLNGDGKPDLAAAYLNANSAVILLNNGSGGFTTSPPYLTAAEPASLAVQYQGLPPLALMSIDDLTGKTLLSPVTSAGALVAPQMTYTGTNPTGVVAGDLNGDGKDDAVVLEPSASTAYVLLNQGSGVFAAPVTYTVPTPNAAAIATLTKGGQPSLVVASGSGNLEVLANQGSGAFGSPMAFPVQGSPVALAMADFNGDGIPDAAVANGGLSGSAISIVAGNGQGGFGSAVSYLAGEFATAIAVADLNNDGHPDVIAATGNPSAGGLGNYALALTVLLNKGDGTFTPGPQINALPASATSLNGIFQVVTGDFNLDGKTDLAVVENNGNWQIQILLGNGDGTFRAGAVLTTEFGANAAVSADLNGDGIVDLVIGHCCGETDDTYLLGNGDGTFQAEVDFPAGASPQGLALADWSGLGLPDLAVTGQILFDAPGAKGYFLPLSNVFPPAIESAASYAQGTLAPSEIVTLKGHLLASSTADAFPLPTAEGGATVAVNDSTWNSLAAPLYYVSPTQINFEVPANMVAGSGAISLIRSDGTPVYGLTTFANTAPGIFQLNASSLAAAETLLVEGANQTFGQVYQVGASNSVVPLPIDLSQGQVYLILYGTGIRNAKSVTVTIGGQSVPVPFAGAQGYYAGEDQVNVGPLPQSLAGSGNVNIVLTADGQVAKTVNVTFK